MQLSPSTVASSSDPNVLALLFPGATPLVPGLPAPAPASPLPLGEGGFENIFSALTPAAIPPAAARVVPVPTDTARAAAVTTTATLPEANPSIVTAMQSRAFAPAPARVSTAAPVAVPPDVSTGESPSIMPAKTSRPTAGRFSADERAPLTKLTHAAEDRASESAGASCAELATMPFHMPALAPVPAAASTAAESAVEMAATTPREINVPPANASRVPNQEGAPIDRPRPETASALRDGVTSTRQLDPARATPIETPRPASATRAPAESPAAPHPATEAPRTSATTSDAQGTPATTSEAPRAPATTPEAPRAAVAVIDDTLRDGLPAMFDEALPATVESPIEPRSVSISDGRDRVQMPEVTTGVRAPKTLPAADKANFADEPRHVRDDEASSDFQPDKSFVTTPEEPLTPRVRRLGTSVANSAPVMPLPASTTPSPHPAFEYAGAPSGVAEAAMVSTFAGELSSALPPPAVQAASGAHQAVETILRAVETAADREQTSVKLDFSVGDAELSVRVELHAEEVRTTFRTESTELRTALAQEWQAVNGGASERGVRLAPAVFTTAEQSGTDASAGDSASRQHDRNPARRDDGDAPAAPVFGRAGSFTSQPPGSAGASLLSSLSPLAPAGTARRLNLFA